MSGKAEKKKRRQAKNLEAYLRYCKLRLANEQLLLDRALERNPLLKRLNEGGRVRGPT